MGHLRQDRDMRHDMPWHDDGYGSRGRRTAVILNSDDDDYDGERREGKSQ